MNTNMQPTCIRVGYGAIAQIHQQKLDRMGVRTLAIVETHPERRMAAAHAGFQVASKCAEVAHLRPTFWDICVPTQYHVDIVEAIAACDRRANILIEKPICRYSDILRIERVLRQFNGKVVVNENYCSSAVTEYVRQAFERLDIQVEHIAVEMTKHRGADVASGRFLDEEFGALGYEGPHLLAIVQHLGQQYLPGSVVDIAVEDAIIPTRTGGSTLLAGQGGIDLTYVTPADVEVNLYTSLVGRPKYVIAPVDQPGLTIGYGETTRHRVLHITGADIHGDTYQIAGWYEPIRGYGRSLGAAAISKNGALETFIQPIWDDTIGTHLARAVRCFTGADENPCSVMQALRMVRFLEQCARPTIGAPISLTF
jgi:Oxidoreductase family, NAD-binding Rossmann fold